MISALSIASSSNSNRKPRPSLHVLSSSYTPFPKPHILLYHECGGNPHKCLLANETATIKAEAEKEEQSAESNNRCESPTQDTASLLPQIHPPLLFLNYFENTCKIIDYQPLDRQTYHKLKEQEHADKGWLEQVDKACLAALLDLRAVQSFQRREYQIALTYWSRALALRTNMLHFSNADIARTACNIGVVLFQLGHNEESICYFEQAVHAHLVLMGEKHDTQHVPSLLSQDDAAEGTQTKPVPATHSPPNREVMRRMQSRDFACVLHNKGVACRAMKRPELAVSHFYQARKLLLGPPPRIGFRNKARALASHPIPAARTTRLLLAASLWELAGAQIDAEQYVESWETLDDCRALLQKRPRFNTATKSGSAERLVVLDTEHLVARQTMVEGEQRRVEDMLAGDIALSYDFNDSNDEDEVYGCSPCLSQQSEE